MIRYTTLHGRTVRCVGKINFEIVYICVNPYFICRNLSKVILRKDLPRIYTMCLPNKLDDNKPLSKSLIDLDINREEVVKEVSLHFVYYFITVY